MKTVDKIMDFLENTLKIEDTKSIQIEKAQTWQA